MGKYTKNHIVYMSDDGEVPSVTTILKLLNKPALVYWANYLGFKRRNVDDELNEKAEIGTQVHKIIDAYLNNEMYIFAQSRYINKTMIVSFLNTFINWKKENNFDLIFTEKSFVNNKYAGTVDCYGVLNGKKTIIDFKTSKDFYLGMFLQLAAYTTLLEENEYEVEQVGILIVRQDKYKIKLISREELEEYVKVFKFLSELFHKMYDLSNDNGWGDIT